MKHGCGQYMPWPSTQSRNPAASTIAQVGNQRDRNAFKKTSSPSDRGNKKREEKKTPSLQAPNRFAHHRRGD
ncbi:hypothetical protein EJ04DRAFT_514417 [Polyplosphaeria fusca]|uniref:Uncharacterized protein n=1 Tax=Polyplosphaeria fusca TaxID=682080 RepID=A0A9P4V044_9PLEO|nr:hypothetical protein EJ04DRAFT_514417 [Polyplosphaeria fusca]